MKTFLFIALLMSGVSFAQSPEKEFLEITPEQEKKIQEIERKKAEFLRRKDAEEKKKQELAKLAAQKKAEEDQKLAADKKKKEEAEAYTKWLVSERDRKMKEAELAQKKTEEIKTEEIKTSAMKTSEMKTEDKKADAPVTKSTQGRTRITKRSHSFNHNGKIPNTRAEGFEEWVKANPEEAALRGVKPMYLKETKNSGASD